MRRKGEGKKRERGRRDEEERWGRKRAETKNTRRAKGEGERINIPRGKPFPPCPLPFCPLQSTVYFSLFVLISLYLATT